MTMREITGIEIDFDNLAKDWRSSKLKDAVRYRQAWARASNAIEGVVFSDEDKKFIDSIAVDMPKEAVKQAVLNHLQVGQH